MREVEYSTLAGIWGHKECNICPLCIKKACNLGTPLTKFRAISLAYCSLFFETESVETVLVTQDTADYFRKPVDKSDQLDSCIHYISSHLMWQIGANIIPWNLNGGSCAWPGCISESSMQRGSSCIVSWAILLQSFLGLYLVNVFVMKCSRSSKSSAKIIIETICCPECALATLRVNHVVCVPRSFATMKADGKCQPGSNAEDIPRLVYAGPHEQVERLS